MIVDMNKQQVSKGDQIDLNMFHNTLEDALENGVWIVECYGGKMTMICTHEVQLTSMVEKKKKKKNDADSKDGCLP